ncbi:DUF3783 domain-containing protein [Thermococcus argininiproducens]|uniref:DUF3783 domain-containing protein n=1 Tax=Thermococcus argininiproducens TaxID=2866384 RepID=A0A9E7M8U0_9EURY|nr:DUF3783 domain-containing protein [Thermococcus argininiproducens]USG99148.1 DUF3783 domain-containing protein [Thermococcus argininiproducens]
MILVIGFEKEEFSRIKEMLDEFEVYEVPEYCRDWIIEEVVEKAPSFEGSGNWHWRKFIIMHDIPNESVKEVIGRVRSLGIKEIIFATTTPTSLSWMLEDLLKELIREDEYFRRLKEEQKKMKTFYLDIGKS